MDERIDFEELIDLQLSLPSASQSSQEPITDVLDKMCEAMDESNFAIDNVLKFNQNESDVIAPDDDIINLDEFENLLAEASLCQDESNLVTDDTIENDEVKIPDDDMIDLDEFESISANTCLFIDDEDTTNDNNNSISNVQRVLSYEVPVEFDENRHKTERDLIKEDNFTNTNQNTAFHTISVEPTAIHNEKENYSDLEALLLGNVNALQNKLKIIKNGLETVTTESKIEPNTTDDIVTLTINNYSEVGYENTVKTSVTGCKNVTETVTEEINKNGEVKCEKIVETSVIDCKNAIKNVNEEIDKDNTDSDDDYDPLDFEFISEEEASKAGIVTRISKVSANENNKKVNITARITKNPENKLQSRHIEQNNYSKGRNTSNSSNIENRPRKNETSLSDYVKYSRYRYQRCYSSPASEHHVIPEGEKYLDMFRGEYAPEVINNLYSLRNKRVLSAVAMAANFEELAYSDPGLVDEANDKYKDEADECLKKILSTYPYQNRKKRPRH